MIDPKTFQQYAESPQKFRDDLRIDVDGCVRLFGDVMDPWQREDFASLDTALMRAVGRSDEPALTRA